MSPRYAVFDTPLDELTVVADGDALVGVYFRHHWRRPACHTFGRRVDGHADAVLGRVHTQLDDYLTGARTDFDVPTELRGDPEDRRIWRALDTIPYGDTTTYGELAATVGGDLTAQQVGQIVGRNPLSIVIPCHRVVGRNGRLTGYAGGLTRKRLLLDLEQSADAKAARLF